MPTKTLRFDRDVLEILREMQWRDDGLRGVLVGQLDRKLYERTNKALAAMGGEWNRSAKAHVFQFDPRPQVEGLLENGTLVVERDGFFETPANIVGEMISLAGVAPGDVVLEPSAGLGAIAKCVRATGADVFCVEKDENRASALSDLGYTVLNADFLGVKPEKKYSAVIMNPPFEELQDVAHVRHAYSFLEDDGVLVAIMSESPFFREAAKARSFREWLGEVGGISEKLPEGSFKESGTGVSCRIVVIGGRSLQAEFNRG